ncbi:ribosomal-protein-alanine N-acetyltransferase [Rhodobacteraceae bacterium RKSG542]|uniref:ribosomal protein S18-alanine N-acetyltransferase n=1 Tax=Pseudovibrio flavus TaxID=2529854 RepID=UPI0012BD5116|nr:ribosomal protein S18-alanine N-acetyltransferase [Pseudovibrio flavus]MTI17905.1 ribosomal-protein-alanine N-acetyltransferase [Pseudovibrio flavus]
MITGWLKKSPFIVERAEEAELPLLANVHAECFAHEWGTSELSKMFEQRTNVFFVARYTGALSSRDPIGFLILRSVAGEAEVLTIAVSPKSRGRGVGRALMETGIFHLYSERVESLFLEVDEDNTSAVSLYKSLGFTKVGERKSYYSASEGAGTALVMRCDLN